MDTVVTDSTDSYEPDFEDLAYERYKENEFESLLQGHDELDLSITVPIGSFAT
jgi:hypothetical protein